jgi:hypothetical protein
MSRVAAFFYLATLALIPWGGLIRFPWIHENAQWSDVLFALSAAAWLAGVVASGRWPTLRPVHAALGLYLGWAALSLLVADPRPPSGPAKLLGVTMLVTLLVVTSEMARQPGMPRAIGYTVALTSLLTAVAAIVGVGLSATGRITPLVGTCGDLLPGPLTRAQAGFAHPNLLGSYCIFASGVVAWQENGLPRWLRRIVQVALTATVILAFSRALLGFALAAAIRAATTPGRRTAVKALAAVLIVAMAALTFVWVTFPVAQPWKPELRSGPSPRLEATTTSFETLGEHPLFGAGPGSSPGRRDTRPFDAHLTPLNVAATLGIPALLGFLLVPLALWRARHRPTDLALWGILAGFALDGLGQDVEDFRHLWLALGLTDADREESPSRRQSPTHPAPGAP